VGTALRWCGTRQVLSPWEELPPDSCRLIRPSTGAVLCQGKPGRGAPLPPHPSGARGRLDGSEVLLSPRLHMQPLSGRCPVDAVRLRRTVGSTASCDLVVGLSLLGTGWDAAVEQVRIDRCRSTEGYWANAGSRPSGPASRGIVITLTKSTRPAAVSCRATDKLPTVRRGLASADSFKRRTLPRRGAQSAALADHVVGVDAGTGPIHRVQGAAEHDGVPASHLLPSVVAMLLRETRATHSCADPSAPVCSEAPSESIHAPRSGPKYPKYRAVHPVPETHPSTRTGPR
jgi:hypothetical protein